MAVAACVLAQVAAWSQIGIAPVYDESANPWGTTLAQYLTLYLFEQLRAHGTTAVLLNPGGVYTPGDPAGLVDYAQDRTELKYLLLTALKPALRPPHGKWTLSLQATLIDRETGAPVEASTATTEIRWQNTDVASSYRDPHAELRFGFASGYRSFDKSPLGKAGQALAEQVRVAVQGHVPGGTSTSGKGETATGGAPHCPTRVRITYNYKHAAAQAYNLVVNGVDESSTIDSGVANFSTTEGPMLVQFYVEDAPYMLSAEPLYQLSTVHSCGKTTYVIDLAKGGDAHDTWE
jgi:hypothetical protein